MGWHHVFPLYTGKQTAAVISAKHLLACQHWESVYWADLTSCKGPSAIVSAVLVAFGMASCSPEVTLLHVRVPSALTLCGLLFCLDFIRFILCWRRLAVTLAYCLLTRAWIVFRHRNAVARLSAILLQSKPSCRQMEFNAMLG